MALEGTGSSRPSNIEWLFCCVFTLGQVNEGYLGQVNEGLFSDSCVYTENRASHGSTSTKILFGEPGRAVGPKYLF